MSSPGSTASSHQESITPLLSSMPLRPSPVTAIPVTRQQQPLAAGPLPMGSGLPLDHFLMATNQCHWSRAINAAPHNNILPGPLPSRTGLRRLMLRLNPLSQTRFANRCHARLSPGHESRLNLSPKACSRRGRAHLNPTNGDLSKERSFFPGELSSHRSPSGHGRFGHPPCLALWPCVS